MVIKSVTDPILNEMSALVIELAADDISEGLINEFNGDLKQVTNSSTVRQTSRGLTTAMTESLTHSIVKTLAHLLTRDLQKTVSRQMNSALIPALSSSIVPTISRALRLDRDDLAFCQYCKSGEASGQSCDKCSQFQQADMTQGRLRLSLRMSAGH